MSSILFYPIPPDSGESVREKLRELCAQIGLEWDKDYRFVSTHSNLVELIAMNYDIQTLDKIDLLVQQAKRTCEVRNYPSGFLNAIRKAYNAEIKRLQDWVNDLQSGGYVNCVYCGHRYGPDPGTPVAMADILKQHIEICPQHPMSQMKKDLERASRPWSVTLVINTDVEGLAEHLPCTIVDVGHADRILTVECDGIVAFINRLLKG